MPHALRVAGPLRGKLLIDCTNPMSPSDDAPAVGHRVSGAELVARCVPGSRVVKAFNTVPAELLQVGPDVLPERPAVCYCGDDPRAKQAVARYLEPFALLVAELAYKQRRRPEVGVRFLRPRRQRGKKRD
ncbi:MAG: hypothetical protein AUH78_21535 [Gemmatimonadetes bacterium 13_1_40CM_4_69_8]|nr:MAG: hypothetical protein AUH78_21535 [Gemmatimonadetes bacterium 13_1_40CM_4_69_8]